MQSNPMSRISTAWIFERLGVPIDLVCKKGWSDLQSRKPRSPGPNSLSPVLDQVKVQALEPINKPGDFMLDSCLRVDICGWTVLEISFLSIRNRALVAQSMIDGTNTTSITVNICTLQMKHLFLSHRADTVVERMRIEDKSNQLSRFHIRHGRF